MFNNLIQTPATRMKAELAVHRLSFETSWSAGIGHLDQHQALFLLAPCVSVLVYQSIILVVGVYDFDVLLHWMWRLHTWRDTNPFRLSFSPYILTVLGTEIVPLTPQ